MTRKTKATPFGLSRQGQRERRLPDLILHVQRRTSCDQQLDRHRLVRRGCGVKRGVTAVSGVRHVGAGLEQQPHGRSHFIRGPRNLRGIGIDNVPPRQIRGTRLFLDRHTGREVQRADAVRQPGVDLRAALEEFAHHRNLEIRRGHDQRSGAAKGARERPLRAKSADRTSLRQRRVRVRSSSQQRLHQRDIPTKRRGVQRGIACAGGIRIGSRVQQQRGHRGLS